MYLRDGSQAEDTKLGRTEQFDHRSRKFALTAKDERNRSYTWKCYTRLDQGSNSSCVGHAVAHELIAEPVRVKNIDHAYAEKIYSLAKQLDPWPGEEYNGTSILAGAKAAKQLGWIDSYCWAFTFDYFKYGISHHGPAVIGIKWYEGMNKPNDRGVIIPVGKHVGSHAVLVSEINIHTEMFTIVNSWGYDWGYFGKCRISFKDMEALLKDKGEAVFFKKRHNTPELSK